MHQSDLSFLLENLLNQISLKKSCSEKDIELFSDYIYELIPNSRERIIYLSSIFERLNNTFIKGNKREKQLKIIQGTYLREYLDEENPFIFYGLNNKELLQNNLDNLKQKQQKSFEKLFQDFKQINPGDIKFYSLFDGIKDNKFLIDMLNNVKSKKQNIGNLRGLLGEIIAVEFLKKYMNMKVVSQDELNFLNLNKDSSHFFEFNTIYSVKYNYIPKNYQKEKKIRTLLELDFMGYRDGLIIIGEVKSKISKENKNRKKRIIKAIPQPFVGIYIIYVNKDEKKLKKLIEYNKDNKVYSFKVYLPFKKQLRKITNFNYK